jgi:lauroyl/myristoyl acyltransferase
MIDHPHAALWANRNTEVYSGLVSSNQDIPSLMRGSQEEIESRSNSHGEGTPRRLSLFFRLVASSPWLAQGLRPLATRIVPLVSGTVRRGTRENARHIFGRTLGRQEQRDFTRRVVGSFYDFVTDMGVLSRQKCSSKPPLVAELDRNDAYQAARSSGKGAVLVTAHMGSFEVGLAALARIEDHIHVVFKRDDSGPFEKMRSNFRDSLGIIQAPIEDGLSMWLGLRQALQRGEAVVMQNDRVMPNQAAATVDFLHGQLRIPTGGIWLARLTGSPIIPVFVTRTRSGQFVVRTFDPIDPGTGHNKPVAGDPTVIAVAKAIETMVAEFPTQWLNLRPAFIDNAQHQAQGMVANNV